MARPGKNIIIQHRSKPKSGVSPEFKKQVKEFLDKHEDVLRELAKK